MGQSSVSIVLALGVGRTIYRWGFTRGWSKAKADGQKELDAALEKEQQVKDTLRREQHEMRMELARLGVEPYVSQVRLEREMRSCLEQLWYV